MVTDTNHPPLDLDAIEARAKAATPGPWRELAGFVRCPDPHSPSMLRVLSLDSFDHNHPDVRFVAHAREDVPALVAEVRRLREVLGEIANPDWNAWAEWCHGESKTVDEWMSSIAAKALGGPSS